MNHIPGRFAPSWTSTTGIPAASTAGMPPPLECSVHCIRSHELPVSMHMHCTQLVMSLNTIYQLVFWSVSLTPLPALSSGGPFEATSLCARARA